MKGISAFLIVSALVLWGGADHTEDVFYNGPPATESFPMCSGEITAGRCTGSAYCTACKNCKYCAHCNSGGSCGVCGKKTVRTPRKPESATVRKYYPSRAEATKKPTANEEEPKLEVTNTDPTATAKVYVILQETSLRVEGEAQAKVLKRLRVGEEVIAVETSGKYWWQVVQNGRTGWVKKHLLKEKGGRIYP